MEVWAMDLCEKHKKTDQDETQLWQWDAIRFAEPPPAGALQTFEIRTQRTQRL
jgi:hypothetical protein